MNTFFRILLGLSLSGGLMALLLYGLRLLLRDALPSSFVYCAWLIVLLRFVLPLPGLLSLEPRPAAEPEPAAAQSPRRDIPEDSYPDISFASYGGAYASAGSYTGPETPAEPEPESPVMPAQSAQGSAGRRLGETAGSLLSAQTALLVWAVGALGWALWYLLGYLRFARALSRTLTPPTGDDLCRFSALGGSGRVRLRRSGAVKTPMLLGIGRPLLVLPDREYSPRMLEDILRHELTHYRRGDVAVRWFAVLVYSLHWFNPAMLLLRRELERECELSCDERLLRDMDREEKQSYGETLLALAANRALPRQVVATTLVTEKRNLKERLEHIMRFKRKGPAAVALALAVLLLLCGCGAVAGPQAAAVTSAPIAAPSAAPAAAPVKDGSGTVRVSTVDEFLAAIAPDTTIVFAPGVYDLSSAKGYGETGGDYYEWVESYDGPELSIMNVSGLTLRAADDADVTISAVPRYADVLFFSGCKNISLDELTLGHTKEPGECAGGVLNFEYCDNVLINDCELFGCGIMGVQAVQCRTLHVTETHIYDCSYGAAYIESSRDVLFDDCEIDNCDTYNALFEFVSSGECAVTNSEVSRCTAPRLLLSSYCAGVYMGAVEVENNSFNACMFTVIGEPVTLEGCALLDNACTYWYGPRYDGTEESVRCVSTTGAELDEAALSAMRLMEDARWSAKPEEKPAVAAPTVSEDGAIHVSSVDELLSAIAPNAKIYLEDGVYDLSAASGYGSYIGEYFSWSQNYDGPSLVIFDVDGLTIMAGGEDKTTVSAVPRYANVLNFLNCDGLTLSGFTAGHTEEPGACAGGVLYFSDCDDARIESCSLFGCGILGIAAADCDDMTVSGTEIYDCSQGAVNATGCERLSFEGCDIHGCGSPELYFNNPDTVNYDGAALKSGSYVMENGKPSEWTAVDQMFSLAGELGGSLGELIISIRYDQGLHYAPVLNDLNLGVGVDTLTLTAFDTATEQELTDTKWSVSDAAALSLTTNADGSCTVSAVAAAEGGVSLTAESGGKSCAITVFCRN